MTVKTLSNDLGGWLSVSSAPPGTAWEGATPYFIFGTSSDQLVEKTLSLPADYDSDLTALVTFSAEANSGVFAFRTQCKSVAVGEDRKSVAFSTLEKSASEATAPSTVGQLGALSDVLGTPTFAAEDLVTIQLGRENGTSGSNISAEVWWWNILLTYDDGV